MYGHLLNESPGKPWRRCEGQPSPGWATDEWQAPPVLGLCSGEAGDPSLPSGSSESRRETDKEGGNCNPMAGTSAAV